MFFARLALPLVAAAFIVDGQSIVDVLKKDADQSTTLELVNEQPDVVKTLTTTPDLTLFAPTNEAWANLFADPIAVRNQSALVKQLLLYHILPSRLPSGAISARALFRPTLLTEPFLTIVPGGQVIKAQRFSNANLGINITTGAGAQSRIVTKDIPFSNGLIQTIDRVFTIPALVNNTAVVVGPSPFTDYTDALKQVGLLDNLNSNTSPQVTYLAPNNAAFDTAGTLPTGDALKSLLEYHLINGTIARSTDLFNGRFLRTVNGALVRVRTSGSRFFFNDVEVFSVDTPTKNGVIYILDGVLTPPK